MTKLRGLSLTVLAILAFSVWYVGISAERAIADRRIERAQQADYWRCEKLPDESVLRRVFVQRMLRDSGYGTFRRGAKFWAYYPYVAIRVDRMELIDDFLKTPSLTEKGCTSNMQKPQ